MPTKLSYDKQGRWSHHKKQRNNPPDNLCAASRPQIPLKTTGLFLWSNRLFPGTTTSADHLEPAPGEGGSVERHRLEKDTGQQSAIAELLTFADKC